MKNDLIKVYYNDVFVSVKNENEPYEVAKNCPFIMLPRDEAENIAEENIENRVWDGYLIPELLTNKNEVLFN